MQITNELSQQAERKWGEPPTYRLMTRTCVKHKHFPWGGHLPSLEGTEHPHVLLKPYNETSPQFTPAVRV